jgi:flagellar hook assembly protein FlgD
MTVVLPNNESVIEATVVVYDMTGNAVFETTTRNGKVSWNLTNNNGRYVANGSYLVLAEIKGASKEVYQYSAKLGVKR